MAFTGLGESESNHALRLELVWEALFAAGPRLRALGASPRTATTRSGRGVARRPQPRRRQASSWCRWSPSPCTSSPPDDLYRVDQEAMPAWVAAEVPFPIVGVPRPARQGRAAQRHPTTMRALRRWRRRWSARRRDLLHRQRGELRGRDLQGRVLDRRGRDRSRRDRRGARADRDPIPDARDQRRCRRRRRRRPDLPGTTDDRFHDATDSHGPRHRGGTCRGRQGRDRTIVVIDVGDLLGICGYFVIATASNPRQVKAVVDEVEEQLGERFDDRPRSVEGATAGGGSCWTTPTWWCTCSTPRSVTTTGSSGCTPTPRRWTGSRPEGRADGRQAATGRTPHAESAPVGPRSHAGRSRRMGSMRVGLSMMRSRLVTTHCVRAGGAGCGAAGGQRSATGS